MGDIGPIRRRIEVIPTTKPVLPVPAEPAAPNPVREPAPAPRREPAPTR
ncbi:hypothetical protein ACFWPX_29605 [Nocardia sp. NPDC058518]